ncbi:hypothetical protein [Sinobaca qinghaiensis]|nr:hypothetical protein [Sinobaca qinghaiensis]
MKQKAVMAAGLFLILAAGCSQEEAGPAVEEAESAEVSEAKEEAGPETEGAAEEPAVEEQEADSEKEKTEEAASESEEQQETSTEETVEEEKDTKEDTQQGELAGFARDWLILDDETGNFISFRVKLADNNTLQATYDGFQSGEVEVNYEIISVENGVVNIKGDIEHMGGSKITLKLLDDDKLLWKHSTKELTFDTEEDAIAKDIERNENQSNIGSNETNSSSESAADSTSETAAESETAFEPDTESMSLEEQLVEELIQYGIGNGGTRDSFTFYDQAWETGADGNQYYVMTVGDGSKVATFHGGEDGHLYFLNLDTFPNEETAEYTRVDSY